METEIKRWGNSAAVRLPAKVLAKAGLEVNSSIKIEVLDGEIVIKPASSHKEYTMDELLSASPASAFILDEEDREWLNDAPKGEELL